MALAEEAGVPPGVFSCVTGAAEAIGGVLTGSPLVRKLSFTGSTPVGKLLLAQCAATVKKVSLELGGNAPFIVFDDADLDAAVTGALAAKYRNAGQACIAANRILVHDSIYDVFAQRFAAAAAALPVGNGFDPESAIGPLIDEVAVRKADAHVADASAKGARILAGGERSGGAGTFYPPTVLAEVTPAMRIFREETFGPVAPLLRFGSEAEVVGMANETPFGLASYFYGRDIARVWRVAERLDFGMIGVNEAAISVESAPFGGVKESGLGREGSRYGIEDYTELKYLCLGLR